jgi:hypothetical protein
MDVKDLEAVATRWKGALWASERAGRRLPKVGLLAALSTAAIMTQPHLALGLPGHRALTWLALLFIMRMVGGPGWATAVGLASAVGTLAIGRSPDGTFWGVLQYVVAGFGVDAFLWARPALAARAARPPARPLSDGSIPGRASEMAGLGAAILLAVGWITPLGKSFFGAGADPRTVWLSITDVAPSAWIRLVGFDALFGAGAGLIAYGLVHGVGAVAAHRRRRRDGGLAPAAIRS